jgi:hypothetical protein
MIFSGIEIRAGKKGEPRCVSDKVQFQGIAKTPATKKREDFTGNPTGIRYN